MNVENGKGSSVPFFSVIIATYNRANLIPRAIDSLINQTESDWEAIIVDDGSTDNTYTRISSYLKTFPGISYIGQQHKGGIYSKNAGIMTACGKYITFLDSDDEYEPGHLESRKSILVQNPSVGFLYGGAKVLGNQYVPDRFNIRKKIRLDRCVIGGTFFIERSTAKMLNGFREIDFGSDADLFDRIREAGIKIMKVKKLSYVYHHDTEDSITNMMLTSAGSRNI